MIFSAPRFVVVDDKVEHLRAIVSTFQKLGTPCMGIHYQPEFELDPVHFRGVRALFLDLHLIDGIAKTDNKSQYAQIAAILEKQISPSGGPFILVIWTENPQLSDELRQYLDGALDQDKPHARPVAILCLAKEKFINVGDGTVTNADELQRAVTESIQSNPQLAALLGWEVDVLSAAGDTLAELVRLVPVAERHTAAFPDALNIVLSRLARQAVGRPNVEVDRRAAITTVIAPILADRVLNQASSAEKVELWKKAVTHHDDEKLASPTEIEAGRINRMLHVAVPVSEAIRPTDWGAVVELPAGVWNSDEAMLSELDATRLDLLNEEFGIKPEDHAKCSPRLVRIGAACDYAQKRRGPLVYLLGLELPAEIKHSKKLPEAVWRSPAFALNESTTPFQLLVNVRFTLSKPAAACVDWQTQYRLRDQLLMTLLYHSNGYTSRPGIVEMRAK